MLDLAMNLMASLIAGLAVWIAHQLHSLQKVSRRRAFFGITPGAEVLLFMPRHASSPRPNSVHRNDVAAVVELAIVVKECGGVPVLVTNDVPERAGAGRSAEFCIGGPVANHRTKAYLRSLVPGVKVEVPQNAERSSTLWVGGEAFQSVAQRDEYVLCIRAYRAGSPSPVFLIVGQVALANLAAAHYLATNDRLLHKAYRRTKAFCLVLRIAERGDLGMGHVEIVGDKTADAFDGSVRTAIVDLEEASDADLVNGS